MLEGPGSITMVGNFECLLLQFYMTQNVSKSDKHSRKEVVCDFFFVGGLPSLRPILYLSSLREFHAQLPDLRGFPYIWSRFMLSCFVVQT